MPELFMASTVWNTKKERTKVDNVKIIYDWHYTFKSGDYRGSLLVLWMTITIIKMIILWLKIAFEEKNTFSVSL